MRLPTRQQITYRLPIFLIILLAAALRLYRITDTNYFRGDEGVDMFVIDAMEFSRHRPLIGPFLSLEGINTPPTYYYISWIFYHFTHTPMGIIWGYFGLNMLTMLLLMRLAYDMSGKRYACIVGILFAVSAIMIEHGRQFWSPYPMQPLLAAGLLFLWHAFRKKRVDLLWTSVLVYQIAFSVYPSPAILLPYFFYQGMRWFVTVEGFTKKKAIWHTLRMFVLTFVVVFSPVILFEIVRTFPTVTSIGSVIRTGMNPDAALTSAVEHILSLGAQFLGISGLFLGARTYITLLVAGLFVRYTPWRTVKPTVRSFLQPEYVSVGLALLFLYPYDAHPHRVWALIPFLFLIVGIGLESMIRKGGRYIPYAVIFLTAFTVCNLLTASPYWTGGISDETGEAQKATHIMIEDMTDRGYTFADSAQYLMTTNKDLGQSYGIFRIMYWMHKRYGAPYRLSRNGNSFAYNYSVPEMKKHMYLFCWMYPTEIDATGNCVKPLESFGYVSRFLATTGQTRIYLLQRLVTGPTWGK